MIRFATPSDAHSIAVIHVVGWQHAYRGQLPDEFLDGMSIARREAMWADFLSASSNSIEVLSLTEQSVDGFVHYGASRDEDSNPQGDGEVYALYLHPQAIGHGNGRALMQRAKVGLAAAGLRQVAVWVLETNLKARKFYEKMGFKADGTAKKVEIGQSSYLELRYRKTLG
jgi:ribosomal protein S18 acetylase RimI-like enzyme